MALCRTRTELLERCLHTVIVVGSALAIDTVEEVPHCLSQGERPRVWDDGGAVRGECHLFVSDVQPASLEQLGREGGLAVARAAAEHDGRGTPRDRGSMQVNKLGLRIELAVVEGTSNGELVRRGVGILEEHGAVHPALQVPVRQPIDRYGYCRTGGGGVGESAVQRVPALDEWGYRGREAHGERANRHGTRSRDGFAVDPRAARHASERYRHVNEGPYPALVVSSGEPSGRVRIPLRLDRFVATIEVPAALAPAVRGLFVDEVREDAAEVGALIQVDDHDRIWSEGRRWDPGEDQTLLDQLIYVLMQASLDADPDRLHLHAGLVSRGGRGLLVGGLAGSGKSTLIAQLVERGFDYFTDERVALDSDLCIGPLPKPVSLVSGSFALFERDNPIPAGAGAPSLRLWHVPASSLRPSAVGHPTPELAAIVLVEYRPESETVVAPMHPITVARVLLTDSIDVDRFGPSGALLVTKLCTSVPCYSMVHGGSPEVESMLASLVENAVSPSVRDVVEVAGPADTARPGPIRCVPTSVLGIAPGIRGAIAADRALLCKGSGVVVELDETQTAWFQLLDGATSLEAIAAEVAEAVGGECAPLQRTALAVLDSLLSLGVVV